MHTTRITVVLDEVEAEALRELADAEERSVSGMIRKLLQAALERGAKKVVNSSQGGGSKDTWVLHQ